MTDDRTKMISASFSTFLKSRGMRESYERKIILESVIELSKRFDIPMLSDHLAAKGAQICRATIFNTISLFIEANILRRQRFDNGQYHYELTSQMPSGHQLHLMCTACGKLSDLRNAAIIRELTRMSFGKFQASYLSLTVYGLCPKCQRKAKKSNDRDAIQLKLFK